MYGFFVKLRLFLASYVLLFVALAFRFEAEWLMYICIALAAVGLLDAINLLFRVPRKLAKTPVTFDRINDIGSDVSGYMATYLLPFLTVGQPTARDLTGYLIFIIVAGLIYTRSNMIQVNPTFYLLGHKVSRVESGNWSGYVISPNGVKAHQTYQGVKISSNILIISR
jgi:hypothetical protein